MHKAPNAFNPSGTIRKKFLLCKSTKKARYVRSLGKKPHFGAFPEAKKVLLSAQSVCARLRTGPIIMQIPRGYQKKKFIVYKVCNFVDKVEISVLRGVGWVPQKSAGLVQRPQHKSTPDPVAAQKTFHLALFLSNLAILKSAALFQGLN